MQQVKVMMMISSQENPIPVINKSSISLEPITIPTSPTWKLYENPFYNSHNKHQQHSHPNKPIHHLNLPLSARKIAASFWDLTFLRPVMETELDFARAQIIELKAELEYERKTRRKGERMNKRLAKELSEERRGREALERVCEQLAKEISLDRAEIDLMRREMEEERKMLRMAEVIREERVQMKLAEAKYLFEEKMLELESEEEKKKKIAMASNAATASNLSGKFSTETDNSCSDSSARANSSGKLSSDHNNLSSSSVSSMAVQRRETENPHIKRGMKGFVEFPKVVRAIGSKSRHWGRKLECQKAQLRILSRQKSPIRSSNLIIS